jgi:hypothetical protein
MGEIQSCHITKDIGPPKYYLGNDYFTGKDGHRYVGSSTYVCKAIWKVKSKFGELTPECTPTPPDDHPEDDLSPLCLADEMKVFDGLLSTAAQWIVLLGQIDIVKLFAPSVILMTPQLGYLNQAYHIFAYLKHCKHRAIWSPPIDHCCLHSPSALDF